MNLANHVTEDGNVDWVKLETTLITLHRMLDNVVSMNKAPTEPIQKMMEHTRRIGVGVMGFADALILRGIAYDSQTGLSAARTYSAFIQRVLNDYNKQLGVEKGPYPAFGCVNGAGNRNSAPYTIAPTGTISVIAGCSSGIEPIYALAINRQMAEGDDISGIHPLLESILSPDQKAKLLGGASLSYVFGDNWGFAPKSKEQNSHLWKTAHEIPWTRHIEMQAAWQEYCHNAVSKTINLPFEATEENIDQAYWQAYMTRCKGITVFRDGSKPEQVLRSMTRPSTVEFGSDELEESNFLQGADPATPYSSVSLNELREVQSQVTELRAGKLSRPRELDGRTVRIQTGHGQMYITVNSFRGNPFEVFGTVESGDPCITSVLSALCRTVSTAFRWGVPMSDIIEQIKGHPLLSYVG